MKTTDDENTTKDYRRTGMSKTQCQAQVDAVIARFKRENPGKPVPRALLNWVDNMATDADVEFVKERMRNRNR